MQTHRHTDTQTHRHTDTQTHRHTYLPYVIPQAHEQLPLGFFVGPKSQPHSHMLIESSCLNLSGPAQLFNSQKGPSYGAGFRAKSGELLQTRGAATRSKQCHSMAQSPQRNLTRLRPLQSSGFVRVRERSPIIVGTADILKQSLPNTSKDQVLCGPCSKPPTEIISSPKSGWNLPSFSGQPGCAVLAPVQHRLLGFCIDSKFNRAVFLSLLAKKF